ncbi:RcnB family protein [Sphingomonas sp. M1-B02]|uniref:RcnB family protein n=1 Tax=Sphingomonas sp. M1-B02 TaxID=3114300 RepID=UPI00223ED1C8|nr:RcnB family protein [Sphingomonas sp. S6-11]UZK67252.1 RcnB family protein [Sphingomonas sp. S6-11]
MKKLILGLVAASIAATPALAAAPQRGYDAPRQQTVVKQRPNGTVVVQQRNQRGQVVQINNRNQRGQVVRVNNRNQARNWQRGQRFDSRYATNYRQIDYRQYRGLGAPPSGYRYVQSGNDAVLVGITSGIIGAVFANLIR